MHMCGAFEPSVEEILLRGAWIWREAKLLLPSAWSTSISIYSSFIPVVVAVIVVV